MTSINYLFHERGTLSETQRHPVKTWSKGVEFDTGTFAQLANIASMPFIHKHVAAMPDAHVGIGATVGSVIATKGAIIPAAVGVDLGCGMMAYQLSITEDHLPNSLGHVRAAMERATPHGRTNDGRTGDRGAWSSVPSSALNRWDALIQRYDAIIAKHPKAKSQNNANHLGTLGTGNHFIELCADETGQLWVMLHSGSRGVGNRLGSYFIEKAKEEMDRYHVSEFLPDKDCAYLVEKTELFEDYIEAVQWAQDFASENRKQMMEQTLRALRTVLPSFALGKLAVNCHHNYIANEYHFGDKVWVTRKGAVRAGKDDLGIIPGSMGTGSFIVRGRGNEESFCSCSHGAGRRMSRTQAKKVISLDDHIKATVGVECRKDADVIDESPAAYKDLQAVINAQTDLIEVVHRLRTLVNVKG